MAITTEAEFTEAYRASYPDLLRFVRRRAHPLNVDDIVGETFLAAWRRRRELPADVRPWLFRTARNAMLNSSRGANRQTALAVRIGQAEDVVDRGLSSTDQRLDLIAAWRELPAIDQEVLALSLWEDLSSKDAAATLGLSRAAYAMRLTRAKRSLASLLASPATGQIPLVHSS
ncbi:MAG TPA: sigma-70 family RNA polymerase sigma factor [Galbitalea sp.]|jgi:RNA polymerase sigma-70 factor (ECF subfamily)